MDDPSIEDLADPNFIRWLQKHNLEPDQRDFDALELSFNWTEEETHRFAREGKRNRLWREWKTSQN
jgi:hypothetical protein